MAHSSMLAIHLPKEVIKLYKITVISKILLLVSLPFITLINSCFLDSNF